jgi:hypothetical protein
VEQLIEYKISWNPIENDYKPSKEEYTIAGQIYEELGNKTKKNITQSYLRKLKNLVERYPNYPALKNYLGVAYQEADLNEECNALVNEILEKHPDYLFGRIMGAQNYLEKHQPEKSAELMAGFTTLKALYPNRDEFHISEVKSYHGLAAQYHLYVDNEEEAQQHLKILKAAEVEKSTIKTIAAQAEELRTKGNWHRMHEKIKNTLQQEGSFKYETQQIETPPTLHHELVEELYHNDLHISEGLLERILALDRTMLIEDLEKVTQDALLRYNYFQNTFEEYDEAQQNFVVHSIQLLGELRSYDSLSIILELLRQDAEFAEYWFGDMSQSIFLRPLYLLGSERLDQLQDFIAEPNVSWFNKSHITDILFEIALYHPERREAVLAVFERTLDLYWEKQKDKDFFDATVIACVAKKIVDLQAHDLLPHIKRFYDAGLASTSYAGDWPDLEKDLQNPDTFTPVAIPTLYEEYELFRNGKWKHELHEHKLSDSKKQLFKEIEKNMFLSFYERTFGEETSKKIEPSKLSHLLGGVKNESQQNEAFDEKIGRNERVSVKYTDGKILADVKFKKVEADLKAGRCALVQP